MQKQSIGFKFVTTQMTFWPETSFNESIRNEILKTIPLEFSMVCNSDRNSHQLNSDFDQVFEKRLVSFGYLPFELSLPADFKKEHDLALKIGSIKVVFEIEKANWEKMFYDLFKAHVYLQSGADYFVLMLPVTWGHKHGVKQIFEIARDRIEQSKKYGFGKAECFEKILLVGFDQQFEGNAYSEEVRKKIRQKCEAHFNSSIVTVGAN